jgi:hypothetical protein
MKVPSHKAFQPAASLQAPAGVLLAPGSGLT